MDDRLATHFAHLFIRDPLVIFAEDLDELDLAKTDHFENIQSTNWQHMRFKPPPADNAIGWRVEFRSMEIQMTDFENAAFSVFMVLVTRAILSFDLNFYIPIKRVDDNMERAHALDAVLRQRFYFRKNPFPVRPSRPGTALGNACGGGGGEDGDSPAVTSRCGSPGAPPVEDEYEEMTLDEIVNGSATDTFPGLIPIVESYLDSVNVDVETRCQLATYLKLIGERASGGLDTTAHWIRNFVDAHPAYRHDSVVSDVIAHDLVGAVIAVGQREAAGRGFAGLGIHGLARLLGSFRGGCGEEANDAASLSNGTAAAGDADPDPRKRKSEWLDGQADGAE